MRICVEPIGSTSGRVVAAVVFVGLIACGGKVTPAESETRASALSSVTASSRGARRSRPTPGHVKVVVEVQGEPITLVRARSARRRLAVSETEQLRAGLRARQAPVRQRLESLGATVSAEYQNGYNGLAIEISSAQLAQVRLIPGVVAVHPVRSRRRSTTRAIPYVGGPSAWSLNGTGFRGEHVKIAILDGGIDYTHANFGGPGTPEAYLLARASDTQPADPALFGPEAVRVKGGIDLVGNDYDSDDPARSTPVPDLNPLDCDGHGSHVAGIAAGSGVTLQGRAYAGPYELGSYASGFRVGPGVAPRSELYAVRVFGCEGSTDVIAEAIEWALDHHMDVINLSLGSAYGSVNDADVVAASNAVKAGMVVVAAAGNSGPGLYIADAPGIADGVLSVAAMDASAATLPGARLRLGAQQIEVQNSNAALPLVEGATYPVVVLGSPGAISQGCDSAEYDRADVSGAIVVTRRGGCDRVARAGFGQAAGAAAVAMVNSENEKGYPPFEGEIAGVTVPFFGVRFVDVLALATATSLQASAASLDNPGFLLPAPFSSGGPRIGDSAVKPNLIAPGQSLVSTNVGTGSGGLVGSGTSQAAPIVTGLAALARQARPEWSALDIGVALTNTADPSLVLGYRPRLAGAGVPVAERALTTRALVTSRGAASINYGFSEIEGNVRLEQPIQIRNFGPEPITFDVTQSPALTGGVGHAVVLPGLVTVPALGTADFTLPLEIDAGSVPDPLAFNELSGALELVPREASSNAGVSLRIPYYGTFRPVARLRATLQASGQRKQVSARVSANSSTIAGTAELFTWGVEAAADEIGCNDVRAVGVASAPTGAGDRALTFAINTWRRCSTAAMNEYDIYVTNEAGDTYTLIGIDAGYLGDGPNGLFVTDVENDATGESTIQPARAPTDSSVVYLSALASQLGLSEELPRFTYSALAFNSAGEADDSETETASFNAYASALRLPSELLSVAPGSVASVGVGIHSAECARTPAKGVMVVLPQNPAGPAQAALLALSTCAASPRAR